MTDAQRFAIIEKHFHTDHCVQSFDAGWLINRVKRLEREVSSYRPSEIAEDLAQQSASI
jgi:ribonuclease BN (tRNA processing enzyme)